MGKVSLKSKENIILKISHRLKLISMDFQRGSNCNLKTCPVCVTLSSTVLSFVENGAHRYLKFWENTDNFPVLLKVAAIVQKSLFTK